MKNIFILFFVVFNLLWGGNARFAGSMDQREGVVTVVITGFKNQTGNINIALFNSKAGFPDDGEKGFKKSIVPVSEYLKDGKAVIHFSAVPFGRYAVMVMHDENANRKMDKNFLGIPQEGYCASNNAASFLAPPRFEKASFELSAGAIDVICKIGY
mgnify:CR=1 FL=1